MYFVADGIEKLCDEPPGDERHLDSLSENPYGGK